MMLTVLAAGCGAPTVNGYTSPLPRRAPYLALDAAGHERLAAACAELRDVRSEYNHPLFGDYPISDLLGVAGLMQGMPEPELAHYGKALRDYSRAPVRMLVIRQTLDLCRANAH